MSSCFFMPILQLMYNKPVHPDITIADLVEQYPSSVGYLSEKGIRCLRCGEPVWGTLAEAAIEKGYNENQIKQLIDEINSLCSGIVPPQEI